MKLALPLLVWLSAAGAAGATWQRHAIVVGNNEGGAQRAKLWFAERDAERVARALVELGAFPEDGVTLLRGATPRALREALAGVEARIAQSASQERSLLVLYYSGHADADALELGSERVTFKELRQLVARSTAAVKVVLVDACQSGALTQVKGLRAVPSLDFALPVPEDAVRGIAYVASTAVGEAAQESASLEGSFFSHHLEVALRGAGDGDGDGVVTLNEAFRYTAARTVIGTAGTVGGAQHPTYEVKMSGRGDVVLADLRRAEARLVVPADPGAQYWLRGDRGLLAELSGVAKPFTLGLPAGTYEVQRREGSSRTAGQLVLAAGETRKLEGLVARGLEQGGAKGGAEVEVNQVFVGASLVSGALPNAGLGYSARLGASRLVGPMRLRLRVDGFFQSVVDGVLSYQLWGIGGAAGALVSFPLGRFTLELGPELTGMWAQQRAAQGEQWSAPMWGAVAVVAGSVSLGAVRIGLEVCGGAVLLPVNSRWRVAPSGNAALTLGYAF